MKKSKYQKIKKQMDELDHKIIFILLNRGVSDIYEIANELNISVDKLEQKLKKIKELGLIGYLDEAVAS